MKNKTIQLWGVIRYKRVTYVRYTRQEPNYEYLQYLLGFPGQLENLAEEKEYQETLTRYR